MASIVDELLKGGSPDSQQPNGSRLRITEEPRQLSLVDRILRGEEDTKIPQPPRLEQYEGGPKGRLPPLTPAKNQGEQADAWTTAKTGFVNNLEKRIEMFSEARGIGRERYGVQDGEIFYIGGDGLFHKEFLDDWLSRGKKFAIDLASSPSTYLGAFGAMKTGKVFGAALLGAGGEGVRKAVGGGVFGDPGQTTLGNISSMALAGAESGLGEKVGQKVIGAIDRVRGPMGARVLRNIDKEGLKDLPSVIDKAKPIEELEAQWGVNLNVPQRLPVRSLVRKGQVLAHRGASSEIMGENLSDQIDQLGSAVNRFANIYGAEDQTTLGAGKNAVKAATRYIEDAYKFRKDQAEPLYTAARQRNPQVNVETVLNYIDEEIEKVRGSGVARELTKIRDTILSPDTERIIFTGGQATGTTFEAPLTKLHGEQLILGGKIAAAAKVDDPVHNTMAGYYKKIRTKIMDALKDADEDYRKAATIYSEVSSDMEEIGAKKGLGIIADIAELQGQEAHKVSQILFNASMSSRPEVLRMAKNAIISKGGEDAWNMVVGTSIRDMAGKFFEHLGDVEINQFSKSFGKPEQFFNAMVGGANKRKVWEEALGPEGFKNLEGLMELFRRASILRRKESATHELTEAGKELDKSSKWPIINWLGEVAAKPLRSPLLEPWQDFRRGQQSLHDRNLAEALTAPETTDQLRKLLRLNPKSREFIEGASTFFVSAMGEGARDYYQEQAWKRKNPFNTQLEGKVRFSNELPVGNSKGSLREEDNLDDAMRWSE